MKEKALTIALLVMMSTVNGQSIFEPPLDKLSVTATFTDQIIKVDGTLNEEAWKDARILSDFIQVEPNQGNPSAFRTFVRVLYSEKYLFIGAFCEDLEGKKGLRVPDLTRDFSFLSNDTFAVGIDGFLDERNSVTLATNPYGSQKDYLSFDDTFFDGKWNGLWKVRTSITEEGWYAEFQIPWKTLRYSQDNSSPKKWGINFVRQRRKSNEISAWSPYPRAYGFNRSEYFGWLDQVRPPKNKTNIQVNPFVVNNHQKTEINGESTVKNEFSLGGELKWALDTNTLLDVTVNTDFAQAEVDRQINNISRFSVFFPERRQFFLENASLFGAGLYSSSSRSGDLNIIPFFSRRIGLDDEGSPIPIDAGFRLVHQSLQKSFGLMGIRESGSETQNDTYNFVGRYVNNFGKQNRVGAIATTRVTNGNTNMVTGVDGFFRLTKVHSLGFMALGSLDTQEKSFGFGGYAQYRYDTNALNAWWTQSILNEGFNPQLGFTSRTNVIATTPGIIANYRGKLLPFKKFLRAFRPRAIANIFHESSSGSLSERELALSPFWLEAQNGGFLSVSTSSFRQNITNPFFLLGQEIESGSYDYLRHTLGLGSDPSSKISFVLNYTFGDFYNGRLENWKASLTTVPAPHLFLSAAIDINDYANLGTESISDHANLLTLEGRFFLNPRVSLSGIYQKNSQDDSDFLNVRFAWEYNPLSYLFVVFNSNQNKTDGNRFLEQQAIVKLSFLKQF